MTLLEKALASSTRRKNSTEMSNEELDVFFAWLRGKVSMAQVQVAVAPEKRGTMFVYTFLVRATRYAWEKGLLVHVDALKGGA